MAGSQKEFELLFKLKASLGGGFNTTFKNAIETNKKLQDSLKSVNSLQSKIDSYAKQASAIDKNKEKLQALTLEHDKLQRELNETQEPSEALRKKLEKNENQIQQTTAKIEEQTKKLDSLGEELKQAGISTDNLENANSELQKSYDKLKYSQDTLRKINEEQVKIKESISRTKGQIIGTIGVFGTMAAAVYAGPVKAAMAFESNMAEVAKVVDWLKDSTGNVTKEYAELKNEIIGMTTKIPMTAEEISQIMAAAGQSNVATDNKGLVEFTEAAAKMGIAFDTTSEQAGDWMAKWRTSFKMSQSDVIALADKINYLGNTSAANAQEISNVVTKIGPLGEVAGLASGQIAALGASMIGVGVQQDVAATGIKNLMLAMVAGNSVTKRQAGVLDKLGINSKKLAERMQTDATGAILDFLEAIKKLPEAEQAAALKNYFGSESIAAISPLLTNLDGLKEQFEKVGDASKYAGSMEAEYASRADTTENKVQLAKNSLQALSITLGNTFLPIVGQAAEKITELITRFTDFAEKNPELIKTLTKTVAGLLTLKAGSLGAKLGFLEMKKGVSSIQKVVKLFSGTITTTGVETVTNVSNMSKSVTFLKTAFTALTGPVGIAVTAIAAVTAGVFLFVNAQKEARQQTLNFSKDLKEASESFQKVNNNVTETRKLVEEYRNLEAKVKDVATSADEAAEAKQRMKEIEDLLIQQNPDVLSKYDQENGKISENLDLVERKLQKELELAKIQYEQKQYEAEQKLPDTLQEIANLNAKTQSLREQYDASKKVRDGLAEIVQEWEVFYASNPEDEDLYKKLDELENRASELGKTIGESWSFDGSGMAGITTTYEEYAKKVSGVVGDVTKKQEELNTATQSVKDYYDASVKLVELDLGGSVQSVAKNITSMSTELANLEKNGDGGSKRALELKEKIAELQPKLLDAAAQIRDLGTAIKDVPEVKTIDVTEATKNIDGFIQKLNQIPTSKKIQLVIQQSGGNIPGYASGGIITKPTLATFAEKVPEAAIPIDGSSNSKKLWLKTGQLLGMGNKAAYANLKSDSSGNENLSQTQKTLTVNTVPEVVSTAGKGDGNKNITITNSPTIIVEGNKPEDLDAKLAQNNADLLKQVENLLDKKDDDERRSKYD